MSYEEDPTNLIQSELHSETLQAVDAEVGLLGRRRQIHTLTELESADLDETISEVSFEVSAAVHRNLKFKYNNQQPAQISPESIEREKSTSCYGLTFLTSEALEQAGVEHWVAYANNHGFILVPLHNKGLTLFINPSNPRLDGEISPHQQHFKPETIASKIQPGKRTAAWFSSEMYAQFSKGMPLVDLLGRAVPSTGRPENDWLTTETIRELTIAKSYSDRGTMARPREVIEGKRQLVTSIFTPRDGRDVLVHYGQLQHFATQGNTDQALYHLEAMGKLYPEIDIRSDQNFFMILLKQLVSQGKENEAYHAIDQLHQNLAQTRNPRADIIRADQTRHIAQLFGNRDALEEVISLYESAQNERNRSIITGKKARVENIIKGLGLME